MTPTFLPGQPYFHYKDATLYAEDVSLNDLAMQYQTPLFVYSKASMLAALAAYQRGFAGRNIQICYALKANPALGVIQVFANAGCGFDIVSGGELERVLVAGAAPAKIIFSGVGKTRSEMRRALEVGIGCFNVESEAELDVLNEVAVAMGLRAPVSIRVNPNVDPKTHPYISTGLKGNKFGIAHGRVLQTYQRAASLAGLLVVGIDCHIGSQITLEGPYLETVDRMLDLVQAVEAARAWSGFGSMAWTTTRRPARPRRRRVTSANAPTSPPTRARPGREARVTSHRHPARCSRWPGAASGGS